MNKILGLLITTELIDERGFKTSEGFLHIYQLGVNIQQREIIANVRVFASQDMFNQKRENMKPILPHIAESFEISKMEPGQEYDVLNEAYRRIKYALSLRGIEAEFVEEVANE